MKKYVSAFLLFTALIIGNSAGYAQRVNPHAVYAVAPDVRYELTTKGERLGVGLVFFLGNESYLRGGVVLENTDILNLFRGKKDSDVKEYRSTLAQLGYYHNVVNVNDFAFVNVGGSVTLGTEKIMKQNDLQESRNAYIGVAPGVEAEVYVTNNFAVVGSFNFGFTFNSDVYQNNPFFGLGFRYALRGPASAVPNAE